MAESSTRQDLTVAPISRTSTHQDDSWGDRFDGFEIHEAAKNHDPQFAQTSQTREADGDDGRKHESHETADVSELLDAFGSHFWNFEDSMPQSYEAGELV